MAGSLGSPPPSTSRVSKVQEPTNWGILHTCTEMSVVQGFGGKCMTSRTELSSWLGAHLDSGLLKGPDQIYFQPGFRWGQLGAVVDEKLEI